MDVVKTIIRTEPMTKDDERPARESDVRITRQNIEIHKSRFFTFGTNSKQLFAALIEVSLHCLLCFSCTAKRYSVVSITFTVNLIMKHVSLIILFCLLEILHKTAASPYLGGSLLGMRLCCFFVIFGLSLLHSTTEGWYQQEIGES
jgi:hypothetical protein